MLKRKMFRDIVALKGQFFAIFFMSFLGMFVYSGIYAEWKGMESEVNNLYEETHLADGWLYGTFEDTSFLDEENIVEQKEGRLLLPMQVAGKKDHQIQLYAVEEGNIDQGYLVEGVPYQSHMSGIWLDVSYAKANHLKLGDRICLETQGIRKEEIIKGLMYHPLYVYALKDDSSFMPDHQTYGFAFVSKQIDAILKEMPWNQISMKLNSQDTMKLQDVFADETFYAREEHYSVKTLQDEIAQHRAIGTVLPLVFLLVAVLSTVNTMKKIIMNQRVQMGTLKALGFPRYRLFLHYTSHVFILCIVGTCCGAVLGAKLLPSIIYDMQKTMYALPNWNAQVDMYILWVCILVIFSCMLAAISAVHKSIKEVAATLLRGNIIQTSSNVKFDHLPYMGKPTFYIKWNLRNIFRNKIRSFLAVFGIMGCSGLLLCSLGLQDSIQYMLTLQYVQLHTYESRIQLHPSIDQAQIRQIMEDVQGEGIMERMVIFQTKGQEKNIPLTVLESTNFIHFNKENSISLPVDGVFISRKLAQQHHIRVGDEVIWKMEKGEEWRTSIVEDIILTPLSQGIYTSVEVFENDHLVYQPNTILSRKKSIASMEGIEHIQYHQDLLQTMDQMLETMLVLVGVLIVAAFLLGIIVLYNFTSLSFYERTFEIATLKVLGFHNKQTRKINRTQNELLCFVGLCTGIPFGYMLLSFMVSTLSENMDVQVHIQPGSYVLCIFFTWWMMLLVTANVNRQIKHINMVEALKEVE